MNEKPGAKVQLFLICADVLPKFFDYQQFNLQKMTLVDKSSSQISSKIASKVLLSDLKPVNSLIFCFLLKTAFSETQ